MTRLARTMRFFQADVTLLLFISRILPYAAVTFHSEAEV
jgi:hypothetical protein